MSNEKFTQEPWEISDMSCHDAMDNFTVCFHIGVSSTGEMIADCQSDNKADYERVKANAHLIKAAPEMYRNNEQTLTELEQMIPAMLAVCADCQHRQCKVCQFAKVLKTASEMERRIEQVQKKARGEQC